MSAYRCEACGCEFGEQRLLCSACGQPLSLNLPEPPPATGEAAAGEPPAAGTAPPPSPAPAQPFPVQPAAAAALVLAIGAWWLFHGQQFPAEPPAGVRAAVVQATAALPAPDAGPAPAAAVQTAPPPAAASSLQPAAPPMARRTARKAPPAGQNELRKREPTKGPRASTSMARAPERPASGPSCERIRPGAVPFVDNVRECRRVARVRGVEHWFRCSFDGRGDGYDPKKPGCDFYGPPLALVGY